MALLYHIPLSFILVLNPLNVFDRFYPNAIQGIKAILLFLSSDRWINSVLQLFGMDALWITFDSLWLFTFIDISVAIYSLYLNVQNLSVVMWPYMFYIVRKRRWPPVLIVLGILVMVGP